MATKNTSKVVLTAALVALSTEAIEKFAKAEQAGRKQDNTMASHILNMAKAAEKAAGDTVEVFKEMCKAAERYYVEAHGGEGKEALPLSKLIPSWRVKKSQVMAGIKADLSPSDYDTVYDLIQDTPTKRERKESTSAAATGKTAVSSGINDALNALVDKISKCKPEHEAAIIEVLAKASADIAEIANLDDDAEAKGPQTQQAAGTARPQAAA
jgi:hypothetical protein